MEAVETSRSQPRWTIHSKGSARDQANIAWLSKSHKEAVAYSENKDMEKVLLASSEIITASQAQPKEKPCHLAGMKHR